MYSIYNKLDNRKPLNLILTHEYGKTIMANPWEFGGHGNLESKK